MLNPTMRVSTAPDAGGADSGTTPRDGFGSRAFILGGIGKSSYVESDLGTAKREATELNTKVAPLERAASADAPYTINVRKELKPSTAHVATFFAVQEWEGHVTAIGDETFSARLVDVNADGDAESEEADLPLSDLSPDERLHLRCGAIFRWTIGYEIMRSRQRKRTSQIIFRQLPRWTVQEVEAARAAGSARAARIRGE